ncbi:MAG: TlpA family protein disulfide reductase [Syntrophomonadaceae bacterium]|jgi:thiol-disulfide isomerase/thioredoxin
MKSTMYLKIIGLVVLVYFLFNAFTSTNQPESAGISPATPAEVEKALDNGECAWLLFRSATCPPCVEMLKLMNDLALEYEGKVRFLHVDVDDSKNAQLVLDWNIYYIPATFIIDTQGNITYHQVGAIPKETLRRELNKLSQP